MKLLVYFYAFRVRLRQMGSTVLNPTSSFAFRREARESIGKRAVQLRAQGVGFVEIGQRFGCSGEHARRCYLEVTQSEGKAGLPLRECSKA